LNPFRFIRTIALDINFTTWHTELFPHLLYEFLLRLFGRWSFYWLFPAVAGLEFVGQLHLENELHAPVLLEGSLLPNTIRIAFFLLSQQSAGRGRLAAQLMPMGPELILRHVLEGLPGMLLDSQLLLD
jgi:hypothetical protein